MQTFLWHALTPKCTWLSQNKSKKKLSENTGKTFPVIMPPFTSRGGHNYGNDCTVFVVEKLNWTQLLEELELELRHMDETQLRLMEQKDSNFARAIHHRREDPFYHKRKPFGYWNKLRLCAICWLLTNCRCLYACLLFAYLTKYLHGKKRKTVIECNQSGQD